MVIDDLVHSESMFQPDLLLPWIFLAIVYGSLKRDSSLERLPCSFMQDHLYVRTNAALPSGQGIHSASVFGFMPSVWKCPWNFRQYTCVCNGFMIQSRHQKANGLKATRKSAATPINLVHSHQLSLTGCPADAKVSMGALLVLESSSSSAEYICLSIAIA